MPYIKDAMRRDARYTPRKPGELTYAITDMLVDYIRREGLTFDGAIVVCLGALEATKLELYRRVVAPYEDQKREENGDVYGG